MVLSTRIFIQTLRLALFAVVFTAQCGAAVFSAWAPGVINPEAGTMEMDATFLRPRAEMQADWRFLFQATGNSPKAGNTVLGIVFCPPGDGRDFLAVAQSRAGGVNVSSPAPEFVVGRNYRVAIAWGAGVCELWFDGRRLARQRLVGGLATLPAKFTVGQAGYFDVSAVRASSVPRPAAELARKLPLAGDESTTWRASDSGPVSLARNEWQRATFAAGLFPDRAAASFVATAGTALVVPFRIVNFTDRSVTFSVAIEVRDRAGRSAGRAETKMVVPAGAEYLPKSVPLPEISAPGYHEAALTVTDASGREVVHSFGFVVRPREDAAPGRLAGYLGHHHPLDAKPDAFSQLGIQWHRAWASERSFLWYVVEPAPGEFQWDETDHALAVAEAQGIHTLGVLGNPPTWASTYSPAEVARVQGKSVKAYTNNPDRYQPRSLEEWKRYVRAVVTRYRGRVKHWEIYNEVDFHPPFLHASFSGSTRDYAELLAAAHAVIKEVDPDAQVLTSGFSLLKGVNDSSMPAELMQLGAAANFDILALHGYTDRATLEETATLVRKAKPGVPIWQTERQYMGGLRDDYQAIYTLFWCLEHGFSRYFLHEADLDKNFGYLNPTPYYAVTSEAARQLHAADELIGPVPGATEGLASWQLRRTDGRYLQVFAVNNGRFDLTFDGLAPDTAVDVTNLYGESLHRGPLAAASLTVEELVYVVSPSPLRIAQGKREAGNVVANAGFEIREGDFIMDETAARPSFWSLGPKGVAGGALRFVPAHSGDHAVSLGGPGFEKGAYLAQSVHLEEGGRWRLTAWVRVPRGSSVPLRFFLQVGAGRWPTARDARPVTGTDEWQQLAFEADVPAGGATAYVLAGVDSGAGVVAFDDLELKPVTP